MNNLAPSLEEGAKEFGKVEAELFASRDRGQWAPLTSGTIEYKGNSNLMEQSGALKASLISPQIFSITANQIRVGTKVKYARFHQSGFRQVWGFARHFGTLKLVYRSKFFQQAPRKVIDLTADDRHRIARVAGLDLLRRLK